MLHGNSNQVCKNKFLLMNGLMCLGRSMGKSLAATSVDLVSSKEKYKNAFKSPQPINLLVHNQAKTEKATHLIMTVQYILQYIKQVMKSTMILANFTKLCTIQQDL